MGTFVEINVEKLATVNTIPFDAYNSKGQVIAYKGADSARLMKGKWRVFIPKRQAYNFKEFILADEEENNFDIHLQEEILRKELNLLDEKEEPKAEEPEAKEPEAEVKAVPSGDNGNSVPEYKIKQVYDEVLTGINKVLSDVTTTETVNYARNLSTKIFNTFTDIHNITDYIDMLRHKDNYTYSHSLNVCIYFTAIIKEFIKMKSDSSMTKYKIGQVVLTEDKIKDYVLGAMLHDLGKLDIPETILNKPAALTKEEMNIIKKHPELGHRRLVRAGIRNQNIIELVRNHHVKINGSGYPESDFSKVNPIVQLIEIIDIYDAVRSERAYKGANNFKSAILCIRDEYTKGIFEKPVYASFLNMFAERLIDTGLN